MERLNSAVALWWLAWAARSPANSLIFCFSLRDAGCTKRPRFESQKYYQQTSRESPPRPSFRASVSRDRSSNEPFISHVGPARDLDTRDSLVLQAGPTSHVSRPKILR